MLIVAGRMHLAVTPTDLLVSFIVIMATPAMKTMPIILPLPQLTMNINTKTMTNGINDYNQDTNELNQTLKSMGDEDGYQDTDSGTYNLELAISNLSNAEYGWYKLGYDEGYDRRRLQIVQIEAKVEEYHLG